MVPRLVALVGAVMVVGACRTVPGQVVRYEPTPMPVVRAMLTLAEVKSSDVVYDLGSGDGRMVITAAKEFGARGVGIEIDPALVARAEENARVAGVADRVSFRQGDMFAADISDASVVTLFLHPQPNLKLKPKLRTELRAGARIVSYVWDMGDWTPEAERPINRRKIFLWRTPPVEPESCTTDEQGTPGLAQFAEFPSVWRLTAELVTQKSALSRH